jgi:predicted RNase H-like nuclease (RuvC/YqgF family)
MMDVSEEKRMILKLRNQLDEAECKIWFREDRISELEKKNETLKAHIGELQKVIDGFQDMEDRINLALLRRDR